MKEGATYIITLQYEEIEKLSEWERSTTRITQEEFTWKEDELFDYIKSKLENWRAKGRIVDILSITLDLIH
jgi:hypothetical protein